MKIQLRKGQGLYFTSDTHYGHTNICRGISRWPGGRGTRDYQTLEEMNRDLVDGINSRVREEDYLIHLGDWSFGGFDKIEEFRSQLNCTAIHLVLGNHDHHIKRNKRGIQSIFSSVWTSLDLRVEGETEEGKVEKMRFILNHFPICSWEDMGSGSFHLFGHVHLPPDLRVMEGRSMDVGCDGAGMKPVSLDEVLDELKDHPIKWTQLPKDHHI